MDYLRLTGLKVGQVYEARLKALRRKEVRRVLALCAAAGDTANEWASVIQKQLDESSYLQAWHIGLYRSIGLPRAKSTVRDLKKVKAAEDIDLDTEWLETLTDYAKNRAGSNIVIVSGTLRDQLIQVVRDTMEATPELGIEKLTKSILQEYNKLATWQVRRIAQTESMIAMADAANMAAGTLDIRYTKQWCISGLGNTRDTHEIMDGVEVEKDDPFVLQGGYLMYPHDCSMGADAAEIINCACDCIRRPK